MKLSSVMIEEAMKALETDHTMKVAAARDAVAKAQADGDEPDILDIAMIENEDDLDMDNEKALLDFVDKEAGKVASSERLDGALKQAFERLEPHIDTVEAMRKGASNDAILPIG